jgi:FtsZ-binding cell division protein ZapB
VTHEEMERAFEFMTQLQVKLEQFQVESAERQARFEVSVQRSIDAIVQQQAKFESEMAELRGWGKELAKSQVRVQNSAADLNESHKQLVEAQKGADERFSSFLPALERRFGSNGHL